MSFFIKKEEGERVMCKCQNQKTEWIIAISEKKEQNTLS